MIGEYNPECPLHGEKSTHAQEDTMPQYIQRAVDESLGIPIRIESWQEIHNDGAHCIAIVRGPVTNHTPPEDSPVVTALCVGDLHLPDSRPVCWTVRKIIHLMSNITAEEASDIERREPIRESST